MKPFITTVLSLFLLASMLSVASAQTSGRTTTSPTTMMQNSPTIAITRIGSQPSQPAPAEYFTGAARVSPLPPANEPSRLGGASVTFEAGARTAWHTHPLGQTLIVTSGVGRVQRWGGPIEEMRTGDVVQIPPGVKHWHGAAPNSAMTHVALAESQNGKSVDWLEKVSDEQYAAAPPTPAVAAQPSRAQALMGDIAPKLAELTDEVLFGDVWERPGLSKRDRSLVTVSALIALNRPDQLRSHLALARQNGLTQEELIETITHLAFYSGWPNAVSAVGVAREVFRNQ
ncbi:(R)-mandelonitrile lyase [Microcoleus sp. herbarium7]|uniref:(R)-mandelonitrile lyase n=1 Tax=Microcoleus sp. herbarium7 TaxID=3055435 RepID=UPI002FD01674